MDDIRFQSTVSTSPRVLTHLFLMALISAMPVRLQAQSGVDWMQYSDPALAGFSSEGLAAAHRYADSVQSAAVMVIHRGRVVAAWGDVNREFGLHSIRKSLVSALYGIAVAEGKIDLDATLAGLGIDERVPLTPVEKTANIRDIISARSGVYLPAAYAGSGQEAGRPARGAHAPGTHFFYNNWDFNIAGVIHEQRAGEDLYESFYRKIAQPIGMQDWTPADGFKVLEPSGSKHPAHTFRMSTRDLARFGQLYLQNGMWNGKQVIPEAWIKESTTSRSETGPAGQGYAYMWWTYRANPAAPRWPLMSRHDVYQSRGTGGQVMYVIPAEEMVIVLRGDTDNGRNVGGAASWSIAEQIMEAKKSEAVASPRLIALATVPFKSQLPAPTEPKYVELSSRELMKFVGEYVMASDSIARVTMFDGRLFAYLPGEGEAELFAVGPNEFTLRVVNGVTVRFDTRPDLSVSGFTVQLGRQTLRGTKR